MIVARIERLEAADIRDTDTTFPAASATCRGGSCALPGKADYCFGRKAGVRLGRPPEDLADPGAVVARSESGPRYTKGLERGPLACLGSKRVAGMRAAVRGRVVNKREHARFNPRSGAARAKNPQ
jgi:hypothetical protein